MALHKRAFQKLHGKKRFGPERTPSYKSQKGHPPLKIKKGTVEQIIDQMTSENHTVILGSILISYLT